MRDITAVCSEIMHKIVVLRNGDIEVSTAIKLRARQMRNIGSIFCWVERFLTAAKVRTGTEAYSVLFLMDTAGLLPVVNRRTIIQSRSPNAGVKNEWRYTHSPLRLQGVHRDNYRFKFSVNEVPFSHLLSPIVISLFYLQNFKRLF